MWSSEEKNSCSDMVNFLEGSIDLMRPFPGRVDLRDLAGEIAISEVFLRGKELAMEEQHKVRSQPGASISRASGSARSSRANCGQEDLLRSGLSRATRRACHREELLRLREELDVERQRAHTEQQRLRCEERARRQVFEAELLLAEQACQEQIAKLQEAVTKKEYEIRRASASVSSNSQSCFFRSAGNALNMFQRTAENRKGIYKAITKVAQEIEQHYGRLKPTVAIANTFASKKSEILREIDEKEHFRETPYTTFLHLVQPDKIKQYAEEEEEHKFNAELKRNTDPSVPGSKPEEKSLQVKHGPPAPKHAIPALKLMAPPPKPNVAAPNTLSEPEMKQEKQFAFQIGKPEKSFGRNIKPTPAEQQAQNRKQPQEADDDVIIIGEEKRECIEVNCMSSISSDSSASDAGSPRKIMRRPPSRGRSRSKDRHRGRSPYWDRRVSPHRSRSRDRFRRSRSRDRYRRGYKDYGERDTGSPPRRRHDRYSEERRGRSPYRKEHSRDRMDCFYERRERERRREKTPEHRRDISRESESQHKWDKYRYELKKLQLEFEEKLHYCEDRPEKHPPYSEEWEHFWNVLYFGVNEWRHTF